MSAEQKQLGGHMDLKVFQLACKLAMEIFNESKSIPKDERFSLTDQIRRSSRSVAANIAEASVNGNIRKCLSASWLNQPEKFMPRSQPHD
jgi:hypothetical protein